jgi:hypothetical protein
MTRISSLSPSDKIVLWNRLHLIAERNKQRFFSGKWQASIVQEYIDNMDQAMITMNQNCTGKHWNRFHKELQIANAVTTQAQRDYVCAYLDSK